MGWGKEGEKEISIKEHGSSSFSMNQALLDSFPTLASFNSHNLFL